ncbi:hypothetical protein PMAYCL1PPCAC_31945, partial [Pristionchus mayeri]
MSGNVSPPVLIQPETERLIVTYNKISGPLYAIINVIVFFLIIFDPDHRHTKYRRYLLILQFVCMTTDAFITTTSPIVLLRYWIVYSTGIMPFGLTVKTGILIYCILVIEIVIAYTMCVMYCHQEIIPKDSPLRLKSWFHPFIAALN